MPFREWSRMDERRRMVLAVLEGGIDVSSAAREFGVSRPTVRLWLKRFQESGIEQMDELSRRPLRSPGSTEPSVQKQVMDLAQAHPCWGARKIWSLMGGNDAPVCERTVDRILGRNSRRILGPRQPLPETQRFARESSNELWQADFKHFGTRKEKRIVLSVLDDASRYLVGFSPVPNETLSSVWEVLWDCFGTCGLPLQILTDNGPAFKSNATWRWSTFDLMLMLLDIQPVHGRPYHPQTQGKVERFHRTAGLEMDWSLGPLLGAREFQTSYNWVRPHEALGLRVPGSIYQPSERKRPRSMPEPFFPKAARVLQVTKTGFLYLKGRRYDLGNALADKPIGLLDDDTDSPQIVWGRFQLARLKEFETGKDVLS